MSSTSSHIVRVKICCIGSVEEARTAIAAGASALGLVSQMPSGPGVIPDQLITGIAASVPPGVATFLLTSAVNPVHIIGQQRRTGSSVIQLCDRQRPDVYPLLRESLPGIKLVQVVHVTGPEALEEAGRVEPHVDALLLDSGNPQAAVKELGGTGRTHDWSISAAIVAASPLPVYLAGGLSSDNVVEAIKEVRPFGVDVCSGVRSGGQLDPDKLAAFMMAVAAG